MYDDHNTFFIFIYNSWYSWYLSISGIYISYLGGTNLVTNLGTKIMELVLQTADTCRFCSTNYYLSNSCLRRQTLIFDPNLLA